jgi:hypothetical protein
MSEFPQPGELEAMAATVEPPWTDRCIILTYGESQDVDGALLSVFSEGDEISCIWEPTVKASETPGDNSTVTTTEWKVTVADDTLVTRRDMVKLTKRLGRTLAQPHVGAVYGDPAREIGTLTLVVREVTL